MATQIPGLGPVTMDAELGWYYSEPMPVRALGGRPCRIIVEGYDEDDHQDDFHAAINALLTADESVLKAAEAHVFRYYQDCNSDCSPDDDVYLLIEAPGDVWLHLTLGDEPIVTRRAFGDKAVYVSLECSCDWEPEHGMQVVLRNGEQVVKVGPYDGHLTNSDAYADPSLEDVVYKAR